MTVGAVELAAVSLASGAAFLAVCELIDLIPAGYRKAAARLRSVRKR